MAFFLVIEEQTISEVYFRYNEEQNLKACLDIFKTLQI